MGSENRYIVRALESLREERSQAVAKLAAYDQAISALSLLVESESLTRIEESADDWGPTGALGNDPAHVRHVSESKNVDEALGLHPISIRLPKDLVRDLKAIAQINGMGYQPLIRTVCQRFVDAV